MVSYGIPENPSLRTNSWVRMWWLHQFRGYKVLQVHRTPRMGWFGQLTYDESYLMLPRTIERQ